MQQTLFTKSPRWKELLVMGRRSVFGAVGVAMAVALAGCGGPNRAEDWEDAITKVEA